MIERTEDEWLSPQEIAAEFKVDIKTVRRNLLKGELHGYKFGARGEWRIRRSDLMAFLLNSTPKHTQAVPSDTK